MIRAAQSLCEDNLQFVRMDINHLSFRCEFDVIFSNAALHWVKDHVRLLNNALKALKPQGVLLWNFAGDGNCSHFFEVIRSQMALEKYRSYFLDFIWPWFMPSRQEYESITRCAGYARIHVAEENADRFFANADEMIRWIDQPSLVPFISRIPGELKREFRQEVIDKMLQKTMQSDGTCFETFRRIQVSAQKADR